MHGPRLIAAGGIGLELCEGAAAVGHDLDDPRALAGDARPEPPGSDVRRALQPHGERRHRLHRVVVEQGHELVDVVALEGVDEVVEQGPLGGVDRPWPGLDLRHRRPRPL